jgi:spore photoproduct lyase
MKEFIPTKIFYEESIKKYELGRELLKKYSFIEKEAIEAHHKLNIDKEISEFNNIKRTLTIGVRKSIILKKDNKSSDFIVPFTSSGCSARCLYCYLVHNFKLNSNLRIFVNRDDMMNKIIKNINKINREAVYEIGCNSDMVLENSITGNLKWAIEEFSLLKNAKLTFATKFNMVDDLLNINHNGNTKIRISVNPEEIIRKVEFNTCNLEERIEAANKMFRAGYKVGLNIAPIIIVKNFEYIYEKMFVKLYELLDEKLKNNLFIEVIFMTYSMENLNINNINMKNSVNLFIENKFYEKSKGKYTYKYLYRNEAEKIILKLINKYFKNAKISYIV